MNGMRSEFLHPSRLRSFKRLEAGEGEDLELQTRARAETISKRQQEGDEDGHCSEGYSSSPATAMVQQEPVFVGTRHIVADLASLAA
jgi:hypothetical protein